LKTQFHDRLAKKEYRAFVYGRIHDKWGTINRPIGRKAGDFKRRSAERGAKGTLREAVTHFERIGVGEYKMNLFLILSLCHRRDGLISCECIYERLIDQ
jgi:23S rRNA-/tRNA-specific pseudouridylate synthase